LWPIEAEKIMAGEERPTTRIWRNARLATLDPGEAERRGEQVVYAGIGPFRWAALSSDPATGVMRDVDAGYDIAIECAKERGLNLPGILG
jgi:hypothetical protein